MKVVFNNKSKSIWISENDNDVCIMEFDNIKNLENISLADCHDAYYKNKQTPHYKISLKSDFTTFNSELDNSKKQYINNAKYDNSTLTIF